VAAPHNISIRVDTGTCTGKVVAELDRFSDYSIAYSIVQSSGEDYIIKKLAKVVPKEKGFTNLIRSHPYAKKKFVGNNTDKQVDLFAKCASLVTNSTARNATVTAAPGAAGITAGNVALGQTNTVTVQEITSNSSSYSLDPWTVAAAANTTTTASTTAPQPASAVPTSTPPKSAVVVPPVDVPIQLIVDGGYYDAHVVFYTEIGGKLSVWDDKKLQSGYVMIINSRRISHGRNPTCGSSTTTADSNRKEIVLKAALWIP
jgi:hypothetical protein